MKTRNGFVSNSSSSSFVVSKANLTELQEIMIRKHMEVCEFLGVFMGKTKIHSIGKWLPGSENDAWDITETEDKLHGITIMDNFDTMSFMQQIGVPMDLVEFESY